MRLLDLVYQEVISDGKFNLSNAIKLVEEFECLEIGVAVKRTNMYHLGNHVYHPEFAGWRVYSNSISYCSIDDEQTYYRYDYIFIPSNKIDKEV